MDEYTPTGRSKARLDEEFRIYTLNRMQENINQLKAKERNTMKLKIIATPKAEFTVTLTKRLGDVLTLLAQHHYDATCRNTLQQPNVLWRWNRDIEWCSTDGIAESYASWRDLDTINKIMEPINHTGLGISADDRAMLTVFSQCIYVIASKLNNNKPWAPIVEERDLPPKGDSK